MAPDSDYRIKLPVFEGPLDLLLFLIRKSEIDIYDIPIESVTRQYLDVLHGMKELDLEIAGDFFVMAATLMEIKSRMLLPKGQAAADPDADDDDPIDPRYELVHQLLQYKKFKEAAHELQELATFQDNKLPRLVIEEKLGEDDRPLKPLDRIDLWNAFNLVLRRLAEKLVVGEIKDEQVTVSDQMEVILEKLRTEKTFLFTSLLPERVELRMLVASFLAVLELTRLGRLRVRQDDAFTDIICTARETAADEETPSQTQGKEASERPPEPRPEAQPGPESPTQPDGDLGAASLPENAGETGQTAGASATPAGDPARPPAQNTLETPAGAGTVAP